jgi:hypothetical protein
VSRSEVFEIEQQFPREASREGFRWDWLIVVTVAWILFDIFTEPALAVAVASFKFGWNDFANGLWLWRRDSNRKRGHTHFVFYCAAGFWRITVTTFVIVVAGLLIAGVVEGARGRQPQNDEAGWLTAGVSMSIVCLCFVLSSLTSWLAMLLAWRRRHRIWLHADVRLDRSQKLWPPRPVGSNEASRVITSSLIFLAVAVIVGSIVVMASMAANAGRGNDPAPWIILGMIAGMITTAILVLVLRERALKLLIAGSPFEAWPEPAYDGETAWAVESTRYAGDSEVFSPESV